MLRLWLIKKLSISTFSYLVEQIKYQLLSDGKKKEETRKIRKAR